MDNKKNQAFILLGSNLGDRAKYLSDAVAAICQLGDVSKQSSLYKTEPWMMNTEDWFLNQVILLKTDLEALPLMQRLLDIETKLGRTRNETSEIGYSSRTIDLDILYFNNDVIESEFLHLPHPRLHDRRFTLLPLVEIAADFIHPIFNASQAQLLENCTDDSEVIAL